MRDSKLEDEETQLRNKYSLQARLKLDDRWNEYENDKSSVEGTLKEVESSGKGGLFWAVEALEILPHGKIDPSVPIFFELFSGERG